MRIEFEGSAAELEALIRHFAGALARTEERIMASLSDVRAAVERETTVQASVLTLLQQLAAANDPTALQQLVDQLNANSDQMAAAVVANTGGGGGSVDPPVA